VNEPLQEHRVQEHRVQDQRAYGFAIGLATGAAVGVGLALCFAPRLASELRQRVTDSARDLGQRASDQYQQTSARIGGAVEELARHGAGVRDRAADAVARGAREVERVAVAAKSDQA
jgi:gas vesicle protein